MSVYQAAIDFEVNLAFILIIMNIALHLIGRVSPSDSTPGTWWTAVGASVMWFMAGIQEMAQGHWLDGGFNLVLAAMWWPKRPRPRRDRAEQGTWQMPAWIIAMMKPRPKLTTSYGTVDHLPPLRLRLAPSRGRPNGLLHRLSLVDL